MSKQRLKLLPTEVEVYSSVMRKLEQATISANESESDDAQVELTANEIGYLITVLTQRAGVPMPIIFRDFVSSRR